MDRVVFGIWNAGAGGRNRTGTLSPELDFESSASTSSATPAWSRERIRAFGAASLRLPMVHSCHNGNLQVQQIPAVTLANSSPLPSGFRRQFENATSWR